MERTLESTFQLLLDLPASCPTISPSLFPQPHHYTRVYFAPDRTAHNPRGICAPRGPADSCWHLSAIETMRLPSDDHKAWRKEEGPGSLQTSRCDLVLAGLCPPGGTSPMGRLSPSSSRGASYPIFPWKHQYWMALTWSVGIISLKGA